MLMNWKTICWLINNQQMVSPRQLREWTELFNEMKK